MSSSHEFVTNKATLLCFRQSIIIIHSSQRQRLHFVSVPHIIPIIVF